TDRVRLSCTAAAGISGRMRIGGSSKIAVQPREWRAENHLFGSGLAGLGAYELSVWFRLGRLRISARTGLSRAGIRPTARTRLLRSLEPAIRAGQRLVGTALLLASTSVLAGDKPLSSRPN